MFMTTNTTLMELLNQRIEEHEVGVAESTMTCDYIPSVKCFQRFLGRTAIVDDLQTKPFNEFRHWLIEASGNSNYTQSRRLKTIKMLQNYAIDQGLIDRQYKLKTIRVQRKNPTSWGDEEVGKLITAAFGCSKAKQTIAKTGIEKGVYYACLLAVGWDTALRLSDVLKLKFNDLQFKKDGTASIVITASKTGFITRCTLKVDTLRLVEQMRSQGEKTRSNIWPVISRRSVYQYIQSLCKLVGAQGTYRYLRRGAVTLAENIQMGLGSKLVGHTNRLTTVNHYIDQHRLDAPKVDLPRVIEQRLIPEVSSNVTFRQLQRCEVAEAAWVETLSQFCEAMTSADKLSESQIEAIVMQDDGERFHTNEVAVHRNLKARNIVIVAIVSNAIVGMGASIVNRRKPRLGERDLDGESFIYIHPNHRRLGIGTQLANYLLQERVRAAKRQQKGRKIKPRLLLSNENDQGSPWLRQFLKKCGFKLYWVARDRSSDKNGGYLIRMRSIDMAG